MKAVITGDIVKSSHFETELWLNALKKAFENESEKDWMIYRGDEFQLLIHDAGEALLKLLKIKSKIKQIHDLDVRMSLGIGFQNFNGERVSESSGSAFTHSGRNLEKLKTEKVNLGVQSEFEDFDENFNLIFSWLSVVTDNWSVVSAEIVDIFLEYPHQNQEDVAKQLGISQSSISQRLKRANFDLIMETDAYYRKKIAELP